MNNNANIKQFQLLKFINENCTDDHVMSKITILLRRDKIDAPYFMITKIRLSTCINRPDNGVIHAMDILNNARRHNLTENAYNEIKSIIDNYNESDLVKIIKETEQLKIVLMSRNDDDFKTLIKDYGELFDKIDNLID
jgi:hypothetical protein